MIVRFHKRATTQIASEEEDSEGKEIDYQDAWREENLGPFLYSKLGRANDKPFRPNTLIRSATQASV